MAEIKNVVDSTNLDAHEGVIDNKVNNWISQINAGGEIYDIATHHSIKFKDGNDGAVTEWNGLTDIEVVIPSIQDIVQTPVEFAGTVDKSGDITWVNGHTEKEVGSLVFIIEDCTFEEKVCEAGDMAIYDGTEWRIVSGENQVSIVGNNGEAKTTVKIGPAKEVLTVEGKTLELGLDYNDISNHVKTQGGNATAPIVWGDMTVDKTYVKLEQSKGTTKTIGESVTLQKASNLKNGEVSFEGIEELVTDVNWGTFDAGSFQDIVKNEDDIELAVTGGSLDIDTTKEEFVTGVSLGKVTFESINEAEEGAFVLFGGITAGVGQSFVTGVNGESEFTIAGCVQPEDGEDATYVKGIDGSYVTGLESAGSFELTEGSDFATGFGAESETEGDVISSVEVTTKNDTSVFNEAKVENHVLSFGSTNVASGVNVTTKYKSLEKTGYTFTPASVSTAQFTKGTFKKSSDVTYTLNTSNETVYTQASAYYKINTPEVNVEMGGYKLNDTEMVATVATSTFAVGLSGGALPTWNGYDVIKKANITGSVDTSLDYEDQPSFNAVTDDAMEISIPGAYTLTNTSGEGAIEVGKSGDLAAKNATIDLSDYITGVTFTETENV